MCMRDCYDTCALLTEVKDGEIKVRANPANKVTHNFLCPKGALLPKWFHSEDRIKSPLERAGAKPTGDFRRISWEEAVSKIARKMKVVQRNQGSKAILLYYYYGDRGLINANFPHRLFNYLNASIVDDVICDRAGEEALKDIYGTAQGMDPEDLKNEKLIVYWGINAAWTNMHGFFLAKRLGLEIWTVDVVRSATAKRSDKFFMLRPETDVLFALGVEKIIIEEELYNEEFIRENTIGFEGFKKYLEGIKMSLISRETGIPTRKIREFAEEYAEKRGIVHIGYGFQRTQNGGEAVRAISILPALVGKKRGFIYSNRILPKEYVRGEFLRRKKGYKITQLELADYIEEGKIKFIFIYGTNPLATLPEQKKLREAILKSDVFIALHDIFFTDTARFSDIVLPANTFFERFDIADSYYHRYIAINEKVINAYGKSNAEVAKLIARKMGAEEPYLYEDEEEIAEKVLRNIGVDFEKLKSEKVMKIQMHSYDPLTDSGKIELLSKRAIKRGLPAFPKFEKLKSRGLKLITPTYLFTVSSQYHNTYGYADENLHINPKDAEKRKIRNGDMVRIFNEYGEVITRALVSKDIQRGIVLLYKAFWPSILGWNANYLTTGRKNEKYGGATVLHSVWVDVEKI